MNDLELCKRIAEIEGLRIEQMVGELEFWGDEGYEEYNPLTNKALLFDLQRKYFVVIDWQMMRCLIVSGFGKVEASVRFDDNTKVERAILECIVEANK